MDSDHVLVLFLGLLLVGAAVALAYTSPAAFGGDSEGIGGATLASFEGDRRVLARPEHHERVCSQPGHQRRRSPRPRPVAPGRQQRHDGFGVARGVRSRPVSPGDNLGDAGTDPDRDADARDGIAHRDAGERNWNAGERNRDARPERDRGRRHRRERDRCERDRDEQDERQQSGHRDGAHADADRDCTGVPPRGDVQRDGPHRTARRYTVVVTYDGEFVAGHWRDGDDGGSYDTLPERPERRGTNETAAAVGSVRQAP